MAKRTVSFGDYQEPTWEEYTGEDPPVGKWFTGNVTKAKYLEDNDQMMFIVEITDPDSPFKGWGRGYYAPFEGERKFALQEILKALQGGVTKDVTLDWENEKAVALWLSKQKSVKFQTREYNDKVVLGKVRANLEALPGGAAAPKKSTAPVLDAEPDVDDALEDYTEEELGEKTLDELKEILGEEFEADVPKKLRKETAEDYTAKLIDAILDAQDEANDEEGDDEAEDAGEDAEDAEDEDDEEFDDGFDEGDEEEEEEEAPAPPARRARAAKAAAAPAKAAPATRRRRS